MSQTQEVKVPELGESITEAIIATWLRAKGEYVRADEPIVELETDKIIQEGVLLIVATLRFDFKYVEEQAVVKTINILNK